MKVSELLLKTDLREVNVSDGDFEIGGIYIGDLLSWVMGRARSGDAWITIMSNINTVAVATLCDVATVILAEGVMLEGDALDAARSKGVNVLSSPHSAYETALMLNDLLG